MNKSAILIKNIFIIYVIALAASLLSFLAKLELASLILIIIASLLGIVCAFLTCPYCKQLNGVFFKSFYGGVFPIGRCHHCGKSYFKSYEENET